MIEATLASKYVNVVFAHNVIKKFFMHLFKYAHTSLRCLDWFLCWVT